MTDSTPGRVREIREAALTLFAEKGYFGTSMTDIADQLGVKAASLYNHIGSKQELLQQITSETMEALISEHRKAVGSSASPLEQARRAMQTHVRWHARHPRETKIGNSEINALEEHARAGIIEARKSYSDDWESMIQAGVDSGEFTVPSVRLAAFALLEMGIGVALWFRDEGELSETEVSYIYGDLAVSLLTTG